VTLTLILDRVEVILVQIRLKLEELFVDVRMDVRTDGQIHPSSVSLLSHCLAIT